MSASGIPVERPAIAVFGSSEPAPDQPAYETARRLGRLLGAAGLTVLTGAYGGVMEAASRGARESGGRTIGVTCSTFSTRHPNAWVDEIRNTPDLHERTRLLIALAHGFVVLPGKAGTLAELAFLWALNRAGCLGPRPVVLLGSCWPERVGYLHEHDLLDDSEFAVNQFADSPDQALALVLAGLGRDREAR